MSFSPPSSGRGRGLNHSYAYLPYGRGRGNVGSQSLGSQSSQPEVHPRFEVDGVAFELVKNGSKLKRLTPFNDDLPTPLKHEIAGVKFYRTKGGNLLRHKEYIELQDKRYGTRPRHVRTPTTSTIAQQTLCPKFTRTGHCSRDCRFVHDPSKLAACKPYLFTGTCTAGNACTLSHDLTSHRTPICTFFLKGRCNKAGCQYIHSIPKDSDMVCEHFARLGYCETGDDCPKSHVFECPDYANTGNCDDDKCPLPHVQRAGQLRRLAGSSSSNVASSNEHSDEEDNKVEAESTFVGADADAAEASKAAFSQQDDYIRL